MATVSTLAAPDPTLLPPPFVNESNRIARPFLICALPRSRTAWLANFLTHGRVRCAHELCSLAYSPAEVPFLLTQLATTGPEPRPRFSGNADTAQAMILPRLLETMPGAPLVVIRRPARDVIASLERLGLPRARAAVHELARHIEAAARTPGALVLDYADLASESALRALQAHAAPGEPFDRARWHLLRGLNIQITQARLTDLLRRAER